MSEKPAGLVEAIDCAANTMRDMGCTNRALAKVQEASLRKAKETTEQLVDSVLVLLRDYEAVHGDGDLEMQPALYQVRKSLEKAGATEMNNQAAQTMPERRTFTDAEIREWMERHDLESMSLTDARAAVEDAQSMDMLAAAPAASGGEDGLAAGIMARFCNAIDNLNDMPVSDEWARKWTAKAEFLIGMGPDPGAVSMSDTGDQLLAAAPAASGGDGEMCPNCVTPWKCNGPHALPPSAPHPDALPDGTLSRSTAKRVEALAASGGEDRLTRAEAIAEFRSRTGASVSERARVKIEQTVCKCHPETCCCGPYTLTLDGKFITSGHDTHVKSVARAIEQALTQPRGEVAWKHDAESWGNALNEAAWIFVEQCPEKSALLFNNTKAPLRAAILKYAELVGAATTPQPSADAVRELVQRAYEVVHHYDECPAIGGCGDKDCRCDAVPFLRELESLLSAASGEKGVG